MQDCFEKGLLKKETADIEKSKKSINTAKYKLNLAKRLFELKIFEETITNSYSAMFHAARALLFMDGIKEKSHYALFLYIKEKYSDKLERRFINELNTLRLESHEINYGLEKSEIKEDDAGDVTKIANDFISAVEKIMTFAPLEGTYFWSNGYAWGTCALGKTKKSFEIKLSVLHGELSLEQFELRDSGKKRFGKTVTIKAPEQIRFEISRRIY